MLTSTLAQDVSLIPVLSVAESAEVAATVMQLRPQWIMRNLYAPFYTLGAASYLDATGSSPRYAAWAREANPVLRERFDWLYARLLQVVQEATGDRVIYAPALALPGFHIYLSSPLFEKPVASIHCDSQFNLHGWPASAELDQPISFTLSVELPENGGGLYTWDVMASDIESKGPGATDEMMRSKEREFHSYRVGSLALHSGNLLHQAAPGRALGPEDKRITMQGHGVRVDGVWQLYW